MNGWLLRAVRIGQFCLRVIVPLAVLLALGVVLIFFLFPAADLWFVWKVYRRFVDTVANTTGFNSYLVMAGALLGFVLFYRGVSLVLYSPFNRRKRWLGIGILLVLAVAYNLTLYAATKDASFGFQSGTANKYYAITPTGVRFYDRPGVDPSYGIPLQPVTPENIRNLELLRRGEFVPVDPLAAKSERSAETPRAVVYELPGGGYITSAWGIATSSFTNARPSYTDALYEKCVREALK